MAFASSATDLVAGDTSPLEDIFVRDMQSGTTTRVTVDANGGDPNQGTRHARISADGRHVVFASPASDLVPGRRERPGGRVRPRSRRRFHDAGERRHHRRRRERREWVDVPVLTSGDRRRRLPRRVLLRRRATLSRRTATGSPTSSCGTSSAGVTTRVSVDTAGGDANGPSDQGNGRPGISGDGNLVAFSSFASDLAPGDGNGAGSDVFVRDLRSSTTSSSVPRPSGGSGASISDDGRFVAFQTTQIWVHDRVNGTTALASARFGQPANGISGNASVSADGRYVVFHTNADNLVTGDGNGTFDVYVRSVSMPTVASVSPNQVKAGHTRKLTVTGSGFLPGANASVSLATLPGVTVTSVKVRSETQLELRVTVDRTRRSAHGTCSCGIRARVREPRQRPSRCATTVSR